MYMGRRTEERQDETEREIEGGNIVSAGKTKQKSEGWRKPSKE